MVKERGRENSIMIEFASERKVFQLPREVNIGMAACLAPEGEKEKEVLYALPIADIGQRK